MQRPLPLALIAALLIASPTFAADKDALEGTWTVEAMEIAGMKMPELKGKTLAIAGDKITTDMSGKKQTSTYKTDDSKMPKQIDIVNAAPDGTAITSLCIYKVAGDTLTFCFAGGSAEAVELKPGEKATPNPPKVTYKSDPRPTAFDSKQGALMVLKRKK